MAVTSGRDVEKALKSAKKRGILGLRWGFNPNSSSLAADVSVLLLGATMISLLSVFVSSWLRLRGRFSKRTASGKT